MALVSPACTWLAIVLIVVVTATQMMFDTQAEGYR